MVLKLISALDKEFKNDRDEIVRGIQLLFLDPTTGETKRHFVSSDNLKGYDPKMVAKVVGPDLEISTQVKTYNGRMREVLEWCRLKT